MTATAVTVALALGGGLGGGLGGMALADEPTPSKRQVHDARAAVRAQAADVAEVRARLAAADQRLQESSIAAARASEEYNGARWRAQQARAAAEKARRAAGAARADVDRQRAAYAAAAVASYELAPGLTALSALVRADGIDAVLQRSATMVNATDALEANYDAFRAAAVVADVAREHADSARGEAERAEGEARSTRRDARSAVAAAAAAAESIAAEKTGLIARLARLQDVSTDLAARRQRALEARAARLAAAAVQREQREQRAQPVVPAASTAPAASTSTPTPSTPTRTPTPQSSPPAAPSAPSAPAAPSASSAPAAPSAPASAPPDANSGARAAIAFARAQLGEPYRWGAAGPSAWDCSGLTAGAWAAGGVSLPHYSVAQYQQSTPISANELRPGDLVFWGASGDPSSIYHVALYVGHGRIIHAPRTGKPVTEESMYYWMSPSFYARP